MKKILFFGAMVALLLGTAACSSDMEPSMGDNMVRFTIEMPGNIDSRAISDGLTANKLTVAVYDQDGKELPDIRVNKDIHHQTTVEFKLVKGQKYSFAFWAQADGAPYTFDTANKTVNVSYEGAKSNDETRDAFYAYRADLTVTGPMSETIYLYRPFCQLNYGASDYQDAIKAGIEATKSAVTVNHAATSFNLASGATDGDVEVTFTKEILPNDPATLTVEEKAYQWMAMNYFLVPDNEATIETSLQLYEGDATEAVRDITVPNVPVQKNHRTNIVGNLFTEDVNFIVIIDERFDQPDYNIDINGRPYLAAGTIQVGVNGEQYTTLAEAIAAANGETVYLGAGTYDEAITVAAGETVSIASAGDLTAADVVIPKQIKAEAGSTLELVGIKVQNTSGAAITSGGATVVLDGVQSIGTRGMSVEDGSNVTIKNSILTGDFSDSEGYNRGLSVWGDGNVVNVEDSQINAGWYAVNVTGGDNNQINLNNSTVNGWACFNIWKNSQTITATNCELNSLNDKPLNAWNTFSAIKINDGTNHNIVNVKDSQVFVKSTNGNLQYLILYGGTDHAINAENVAVVGRTTNTGGYLVGRSSNDATCTLNFDDACTIDWE